VVKKKNLIYQLKKKPHTKKVGKKKLKMINLMILTQMKIKIGAQKDKKNLIMTSMMKIWKN